MKIQRYFFNSLALMVLLSATLSATSLHAQEFKSSKAQTALVELFTSEGCSSCPPADRWLTSLKSDGKLWRDFVPVAFHVDYWDYIGWKDPFASKEFSQRQRRYAHEFKESTVYTPGVRKDGREWRSWRRLARPQSNAESMPGELVVNVTESGQFTARFSAADHAIDQPMQLSVALLGLDLSTQVKRGENRGKLLEHDFVVLGLTKLAGSSKGSSEQASGTISWSGTLPSGSNIAPNYAVAAWVTQGNSQLPIQAVGGELAL